VGDLVNLGGERLLLPVSRHWAVSLREQLASQEIRDGVDEQHALEQLAVFSLLARWVDAAKVESIGEKRTGSNRTLLLIFRASYSCRMLPVDAGT